MLADEPTGNLDEDTRDEITGPAGKPVARARPDPGPGHPQQRRRPPRRADRRHEQRPPHLQAARPARQSHRPRYARPTPITPPGWCPIRPGGRPGSAVPRRGADRVGDRTLTDRARYSSQPWWGATRQRRALASRAGPRSGARGQVPGRGVGVRQAVRGEPGSRVGRVPRRYFAPCRLAVRRRPGEVDEDQAIPVDQQVVGGKVAVRQAVPGQRDNRLHQLRPQRAQLRIRRPGFRQPWRGHQLLGRR